MLAACVLPAVSANPPEGAASRSKALTKKVALRGNVGLGGLKSLELG